MAIWKNTLYRAMLAVRNMLSWGPTYCSKLACCRMVANIGRCGGSSSSDCNTTASSQIWKNSRQQDLQATISAPTCANNCDCNMSSRKIAWACEPPIMMLSQTLAESCAARANNTTTERTLMGTMNCGHCKYLWKKEHNTRPWATSSEEESGSHPKQGQQQFPAEQ